MATWGLAVGGPDSGGRCGVWRDRCKGPKAGELIHGLPSPQPPAPNNARTPLYPYGLRGRLWDAAPAAKRRGFPRNTQSGPGTGQRLLPPFMQQKRGSWGRISERKCSWPWRIPNEAGQEKAALKPNPPMGMYGSCGILEGGGEVLSFRAHAPAIPTQFPSRGGSGTSSFDGISSQTSCPVRAQVCWPDPPFLLPSLSRARRGPC